MAIDRNKPYPFPTRSNPRPIPAGRSPAEGLASAGKSVLRVVRTRLNGLPSEHAIDHGGEESFPASDSMAVLVDRSTWEAPEPLRKHGRSLLWGTSLVAVASWVWWKYHRPR